MGNVDPSVVQGFGDEWTRFDQSNDHVSESELAKIFDAYFSAFPWQELPERAVGFDAGCGTGRWAKFAASRVGELHCVDPSDAIRVAQRNLASCDNCQFHNVDIDHLPFEDGSMDFGYSLGVLHHVPDPGAALTSCVRKLRPGAPFLIYLYYAFDNRPSWFKRVWQASELGRRWISQLPSARKNLVTDVIAVGVYLPLAKTAKVLESFGQSVENIPLSEYRDKSLYTMRTDSLDRFGTRLEQRFTRMEIVDMMERSGLVNIEVSPEAPYWCAVGYKRETLQI